MSEAIDFQAIFNRSPNPYMLLDRELRFVAANSAYLRVTTLRLDQLLGRYVFDVFPHDPEDPANATARELRESLQRVLARRVPDSIALIPYRVPRNTEAGIVQEERFWSATHMPILDARGEVALILQHTVDVTELEKHKRATRGAQEPGDSAVAPGQLEAGVLSRAHAVQEINRTLDAERQHLRRLFEQAPGFMCFLRGPLHVFELANESYQQLTGHRPILGKPVREALPEVEGQGYFELLDRVFTTGEPFVGRGMPVLLQRKPGAPLEQVFVDLVYQSIVEPDGTISGIFVQGHDISEQKRAQDELRRYREHLEELVRERTQALEESEAVRRQAEAELRHAQKLEAVGQLTGGVAHDFNNLLQVIGGNLQLLQRDCAGNEQAERRLKSAADAVARGARLASQLLAFARRQPLEPRVLHLGRLVRSMDDLLRRALGENIQVETVTGDELWNTFADPHQLENVILNLAINARDAMEGAGTLTLETRNAELDAQYAQLHPDVAPGEYVLLAVSDTGCGMTPEILERVFEPFFTTKPEGRGTGLGLSMVYGFVQQTGGHIQISSEVGRGTTLQLYFPRTLHVEVPTAETGTGPIEGGTETLLVVEDDAEVRATVVEMLTDLGYRVLKATDGQSALAVLQSGVPIDLLFTDVIMPGPVRSTELAQQARALVPELEVLFTSGYTEDTIVHGGRLDPGVSLLSKPYRREDLARKIRGMLRGREQRLTARSQASEPGGAEEVRAPGAREKRTLRILLVEDDEALRSSATELLEALGHRVVGTSSAEEALGRLGTGPFDVLFTDVNLPGGSGVELARRAVRQHPGLRVIISSGYGSAAGSEEGGMKGALLLPKPYDLSRLEAVLEQAMVQAPASA